MNHFDWAPRALAIALGWSLVASSSAQSPPSVPNESAAKATLHESSAEIVVLPESVPDPIEPVNRIVYAFNKGLMAGAVKPTAKV
jgi:ABC-type transporter lipoprotein component MlaA